MVLEEVQEAFDEYMRTQVVVLVDLHAAKGDLKNGMMKKIVIRNGQSATRPRGGG